MPKTNPECMKVVMKIPTFLNTMSSMHAVSSFQQRKQEDDLPSIPNPYPLNDQNNKDNESDSIKLTSPEIITTHDNSISNSILSLSGYSFSNFRNKNETNTFKYMSTENENNNTKDNSDSESDFDDYDSDSNKEILTNNQTNPQKRKIDEITPTSPPIQKIKIFSLEKRDFIEVNIVRHKQKICSGFLISLFGPQIFFDLLRQNSPTNIELENGIDSSTFLDIYNECNIGNILLMKIISNNYEIDSPMHKLFKKMSDNDVIGYIDKDSYELFIIPQSQKILQYIIII